MDHADELTQLWQRWLSDAAFEAMFRPQELEPFVPQIGSDGLTPTLLVHTLTGDGRLVRQVMRIVIEDREFNDWDTRLAIMRTIAGMIARQGLQVVALQLGSEAWTRAFTPEEDAARGDRSLAEYADREEILVVFGQTIDGRCIIAQAPLQKTAEERVHSVGDWTLTRSWDLPPDDMRSPLLRAFFHAYLHTKMEHHP